MSTELPPIQMDHDPVSGEPCVRLGEVAVTNKDYAGLVRAAPALGDPKWLRAYARLVNHLAQGSRFEPIFAREPFEAEYMATYAAEDPDEEPRPGVIRLRDFGVPDFAQLEPPVSLEDGTLVFFAKNTFMGIPYRVSFPPGGEPEYLPVGMVL